MDIGMSIQNEALQASVSAEEKQIYMAGFPSLELYIDFLRSLGVSSIEVRIYNQSASFEDYREALSIIQRKGLNITIHGELSMTFKGSRLQTDYPSLYPLMDDLDQPIIMPIHASQGNEAGVNYAERTSQILNAWGNELSKDARKLQFALENNRVKEVIDPGNTINGVLDVVEKLNRKDVGICWDMGHYYSNLLKGKEVAPENFVEDPILNEFCKHVVHTHIHGINHKGTTHFPIRDEGNLPLRAFVQLLEQNNYKGIYNLELSLERWPKIDDAKQMIAASFDYLQHTIASCRKGSN